MKTFVAVYNSVRDAQIYPHNPMEEADIALSEDWVDAENAEIYIGIFYGEDEAAVRTTVAEQEGVHPNAITLYEVCPQATAAHEIPEGKDISVEALLTAYGIRDCDRELYGIALKMLVEDIKLNCVCYDMSAETVHHVTTQHPNDFLEALADAMVDYMEQGDGDEYKALEKTLNNDLRPLLAGIE